MVNTASTSGFTLIELSIVLVIIGLITGGILVGRDLISAAEQRAQISQIEKYNQAVNTFRIKFNALPGDMPLSTASQFGFSVGASCNGTQGRRDGDGQLQSTLAGWPFIQIGETGFFWQDLSSSAAGNLIDGQFPNSGAAAMDCANFANPLTTSSGSTYIGDYFPAAKIGHGNFIYTWAPDGTNWYGVLGITSLIVNGQIQAENTSIPVIQAYNMDKKIDDGLPISGGVQTFYPSDGRTVAYAPNAATDSTSTCYNTSSNVYSIGSAANYGRGGNCTLSFRLQ